MAGQCSKCWGRGEIGYGPNLSICPECNGFGNGQQCPDCQGYGTIPSYEEGTGGPITDVRCNSCNGSGKVS